MVCALFRVDNHYSAYHWPSRQYGLSQSLTTVQTGSTVMTKTIKKRRVSNQHFTVWKLLGKLNWSNDFGNDLTSVKSAALEISFVVKLFFLHNNILKMLQRKPSITHRTTLLREITKTTYCTYWTFCTNRWPGFGFWQALLQKQQLQFKLQSKVKELTNDCQCAKYSWSPRVHTTARHSPH